MSRSKLLSVALTGLALIHTPAAAQRELLFGPEETREQRPVKNRERLKQPIRIQATAGDASPTEKVHVVQPQAAPDSEPNSREPGIKLPILPPLPGAPIAARSAASVNKRAFEAKTSKAAASPAKVARGMSRPIKNQPPLKSVDASVKETKNVSPTELQAPMRRVVEESQPAVNTDFTLKSMLAETPPTLRINPFTQRRRLAKILPLGPLIGISPGLSNGVSGNYTYDQSYLPLANYLSEKLGSLFVPAYESDLSSLRASIRERRYPVVHASVQVFEDLRIAGYRQIATNDAGVGLAVVVRTNSAIREVAQLSRHSIAADLSGPIGTAALAAFAGEGIDTNVRFVDANGPTLSHILDRVVEGTVDAGIINTAQAELAERKAPGTFRVLKTFPVSETDGFWVLPERLDASTTSRLSRVLDAMRSDTTHRDVVKRLSYVTQLPIRFRAISPQPAEQ